MKSAIIEAAEVLEAISPHLGTHPVISREEVIRRILDLAQRLRAEALGWQPIETAPNGEDILVAYDNGRVDHVEADRNHFTWSAYTGKERFLQKPTHWMPLPEPPKAETKE